MRRTIFSEVIRGLWALLLLGLQAGAATPGEPAMQPQPELLTNLFQLREEVGQTAQVVHPLRIVAEVVNADSASGVLVLRDATGVEFIRVDHLGRDIGPGATVVLEGDGCRLKPQGFGLSVIPGMVVDNDGVHPFVTGSGRVFLHGGANPIRVRWFDGYGDFGLKVEFEGPGVPRQQIPNAILSRMDIDRVRGHTRFTPGLDYRCYEGFWELMPDFQRLRPVKTGVTSNFDCNVRTRDGAVGLEFSGFLAVPRDGVYTFYATSDDGSQVFVGEPLVSLRVLSQSPAPARMKTGPSPVPVGSNGVWTTLEGTIKAAGIWAEGGELLMRVGNDDIRVEIFESSDFTLDVPLHGRVRVAGIYQDIVAEDGSRVPGRLLAMDCKAIQPVMPSASLSTNVTATGGRSDIPAVVSNLTAGVPTTISTAAEIKALSAEQANQKLPVSICGVVTACFAKYAVVQDSTKGVFVDLLGLPEVKPLQRGEYCQIDGVTGPGSFAPVVVAHRIIRLGPGQLPKPLRPTWDQLMNGSLDDEYAEIVGVVTAVRDQRIVLLTEGGKITLDLNDCRSETLPGYEGALVRIQGCVFVNFDMETHRLGTGSLVIRSAAIDVLRPAPRDFFNAPYKSMGELLLYDPKAAPFRLLKVSGQVIHGRAGEFFLTDGTNGMHVTTRNAEQFAVGDLVDAVGFLELGGSAAELREAMMRRTGRAPLCSPAKLAQDQLLLARHAGTLVQVEATLMNQWRERSEYVLELQAGFLAFKARIDSGDQTITLPRLGSRLELNGVYVPQGIRTGDGILSGFELLLHSASDVRVLATPPWWNLKRVLALAGMLAVMLCAVLVWNKQLHRQVLERSRKLELEIGHRQRAELQQAAEAERARIARDLHDELGTGLTEVSLLASTGSRENREAEKSNDRLRAIAEKARALVSGLDVIVWAIDPKRNSLQSFADYLGRYATELFSATDIVCRFKIPIECNAVTLSEAARHSLFLGVKEALNNVIRHASATEVELRLLQSEDRLQVVIADNGCGIDWNTIRRGNGLANLRARLEALKGECHIESQVGKGTTVRFIIPLPRDPG